MVWLCVLLSIDDSSVTSIKSDVLINIKPWVTQQKLNVILIQVLNKGKLGEEISLFWHLFMKYFLKCSAFFLIRAFLMPPGSWISQILQTLSCYIEEINEIYLHNILPIIDIGSAPFKYDMRRLSEILAFPKVWYGHNIARRLLLGSSGTAYFVDDGYHSESRRGSYGYVMVTLWSLLY